MTKPPSRSVIRRQAVQDPLAAANRIFEMQREIVELQREVKSSHAESDRLIATVQRVWDALGIATYRETEGKEISEIVAERMAELHEACVLLAEAVSFGHPWGITRAEWDPIYTRARDLLSRTSLKPKDQRVPKSKSESLP